jgi:predicted DCC family thiol-disulfide oxidoreductase YuxK
VTAEGTSVLLYDADCSFCRWSLRRILAWDRAQRLRAVSIQSDEGQRLLDGVVPEARLDSWHLVNADGRLFSAGAAAEPLVRILPWGRPLAAVFRAFPGPTESTYRYIAAHRGRWARLLRIDTDRKRRS